MNLKGTARTALAGIALALAVFLAAPSVVSAQAHKLDSSPGHPAKVSAGAWDGTWVYVSRDYRIALWLRTVDGKLEHRVQVMSMFASEGFITDWSGKAEYSTRNTPAVFDLKITEVSDDELQGTWWWDLQFVASGRTEKADVRIYRSGLGRTIVVRFERLERTIRRGTRDQVMSAPRAWTFLQASKRIVLWDELPF